MTFHHFCVIRSTLLACLLPLVSGSLAWAQMQDFKDSNPTADDIRRALLAPSPAVHAAEQGASKPRRPSRGLRVEATDPQAAGAAYPPPAPRKLSMRLQFGLNSAVLTPDSLLKLDAVGQALQSSDLKRQRFVVSGHTDASGTYRHNVLLSKLRADAVRDYLNQRHGVEIERLMSVGRASDELIEPSEPTNAANRRVQIETQP
jgi:outer membrane protein OmpA-like peptidoglycan-associated protein